MESLESIKEFRQREEIEVGEVIFAVNKRRKNGSEGQVSRVGRKYFYIGDLAFNKETKQEVTEWESNFALYPNEESFIEEVEKTSAYKMIKGIIRDDYSDSVQEHLSLDDLNTISELLAKAR